MSALVWPIFHFVSCLISYVDINIFMLQLFSVHIFGSLLVSTGVDSSSLNCCFCFPFCFVLLIILLAALITFLFLMSFCFVLALCFMVEFHASIRIAPRLPVGAARTPAIELRNVTKKNKKKNKQMYDVLHQVALIWHSDGSPSLQPPSSMLFDVVKISKRSNCNIT